MTIDNWLELELLRGISDQNLQRRLLQEKDPTLRNIISITTQWQWAKDAVAQFIIENKISENESNPEETNNISYGRTSNRRKGPVNGNLDSDPEKTWDEHQAQLIKSVPKNEHQIQLIKSVPRSGHPVELIESLPRNGHKEDCNQRGNANSPTNTSDDITGTRPCEDNNYTVGKIHFGLPIDRKPKLRNVKITPITNGYILNSYQFCSDVSLDTSPMGTIIGAFCLLSWF